MLDSLDWLFDLVALIFLAVILTILIVGFVWLGSLPWEHRTEPLSPADRR